MKAVICNIRAYVVITRYGTFEYCKLLFDNFVLIHAHCWHAASIVMMHSLVSKPLYTCLNMCSIYMTEWNHRERTVERSNIIQCGVNCDAHVQLYITVCSLACGYRSDHNVEIGYFNFLTIDGFLMFLCNHDTCLLFL